MCAEIPIIDAHIEGAVFLLPAQSWRHTGVRVYESDSSYDKKFAHFLLQVLPFSEINDA